ncbi:MAG: ATP-binding protein [Candidatus Staskawiczbacteria bacterium]|nr:ATP-binding protein [Candidatus Staskawiczbacteria bacterium]
MTNLVLYRKYRPQRFEEVIGQEHVVQTLTNAVKGKNISHAYLFSGPRGSGKTTIARLFAKAINWVLS